MAEVKGTRQASPGGAQESVLEAVLERVTYANEQTGYTIARVATERSGSDLLTVVGPLAGAQVGESLRLSGRWTSHPRYGRQFEVRSYSTVLPATIQGIQRYLGSGLIKGIGPVKAGRMVAHSALLPVQRRRAVAVRSRPLPRGGPCRQAGQAIRAVHLDCREPAAEPAQSLRPCPAGRFRQGPQSQPMPSRGAAKVVHDRRFHRGSHNLMPAHPREVRRPAQCPVTPHQPPPPRCSSAAIAATTSAPYAGLPAHATPSWP